MTYFNLSKRQPEREPEAVEEEQPEGTEDDPQPTAKRQPTGWPGAIWCGMCGPWRWLAGHFGDYGVTVAWVAHVGSPWAIGFYGGWVAAGLVVVWPLAMVAFIPREYLDRLTAAIERRAAPPPKQPSAVAPGGELETVRRLLLDLIGEAHGVHLRTVLAHLQKHGQWEGRTVAELRVHLEALGVPVQPKVKVGGTPTRGVLRADLDALSPVASPSPSPTPSPPV